MIIISCPCTISLWSCDHHSLPHTPSLHMLLMLNSKHLTHDISNLVSLITKTKLGLSDIRLEQWNIWNIHLKHTCIAITTCATSPSSFVISIYNTCNIPSKQLKHLKHTIATYTFSIASAWCLDRLIDAELNTGTELNVVEWRAVHRCGARQRHEPQQVQGQADEARPRREVWVRERAPSVSGLLCVARAGAARARTGSVPWREWAGDADEAAWASVWSVRTDGRSMSNVFDIRETY
jgi:hypothetical protein